MKKVVVASKRGLKGGSLSAASQEALGVGRDAVVLDVTSRGKEEMRVFSPFTQNGDHLFTVPFLPSSVPKERRESRTVEGIWQGLKIFQKCAEGAELTDGKYGVDFGKFKAANKNLKRTTRTLGGVRGHYGGPGVFLSIQEARKKIYLSAYKQQLQLPPVARQVESLRAVAREKDLVFLDFDTNDDLNKDKPLSHAQCLRSFVLHGDFREIKGSPEARGETRTTGQAEGVKEALQCSSSASSSSSQNPSSKKKRQSDAAVEGTEDVSPLSKKKKT
uniref:Uncharacterized protein n=1 Tax=Chromera velia CCMP2878 TaxID=1169474 RepID=A0A0G4FD93_9ALVE|eukprot:Cvel_16327.t1-p1 / transcript=Cvel_16327.t1 / gene=Cvel_16327 / organism=Chromera_velia_CCMP2878 / gene_product=hypothetical protein / transcript_product=hypothetical protein / location=Cvel_scaffold1253:10816-12319(+) / protein_length=274 / sequence_SO=supercontig / SO=protein_coding / is_pseudo=false